MLMYTVSITTGPGVWWDGVTGQTTQDWMADSSLVNSSPSTQKAQIPSHSNDC